MPRQRLRRAPHVSDLRESSPQSGGLFGVALLTLVRQCRFGGRDVPGSRVVLGLPRVTLVDSPR